MKSRSILALGGASLALAVAPGVAQAGQKVSVRIEGAQRTLQAARTVQTPTGFITKFGAPAGVCPGASAAGALNAATNGRWKAKFYSSFNDYLIGSVLGESPNTKTGYWGIWVNNRYATTGACEIKLKPADRILFAVDSVKKHEHPLGIIAPAKATAGKPFTLKVVSYTDKGKATPLAGAHVRGGGLNLVSGRRGTVPVTAGAAIKLTYTATDAGYIRSAATTVKVTK
ncbi:MAG TPA: hypothetical protein VHW04_25190 [Solirubrobacteraceae bacterium]|jgi:hypothetical protein|nr:hypothetical protein [Solirubrobacteraceae bacterium]